MTDHKNIRICESHLPLRVGSLCSHCANVATDIAPTSWEAARRDARHGRRGCKPGAGRPGDGRA